MATSLCQTFPEVITNWSNWSSRKGCFLGSLPNPNHTEVFALRYIVFYIKSYCYNIGSPPFNVVFYIELHWLHWLHPPFSFGNGPNGAASRTGYSLGSVPNPSLTTIHTEIGAFKPTYCNLCYQAPTYLRFQANILQFETNLAWFFIGANTGKQSWLLRTFIEDKIVCTLSVQLYANSKTSRPYNLFKVWSVSREAVLPIHINHSWKNIARKGKQKAKCLENK